MKTKKKRLILLIYVFLILAIVLGIILKKNLFSYISYGVDTTTIDISSELEKYINYYLSDEENGTLVQYSVTIKNEYGEEESTPIEKNEVKIEFSQIDEKYPYEVKVINQNNSEIINQYDSYTGTLLISEDKQIENLSNEDTYVIICNYDTYTSEENERELQAKICATSILANEEHMQIEDQKECNNTVSENIGKLTSIKTQTQDIYNGYIKSNLINGTNYTTQFEELEQITISKKEAQTFLEISECDIFIKDNNELENNDNLIYKSTQIQKSDINAILGEEGKLEILDDEQNVIATVDKDTEFSEDGTLTIYYENDQQTIFIKTSEVINEGILNLKNTKEIKDTLKDIENIFIKTNISINGTDTFEVINEIKNAETKIDLDISNKKWSNREQNEITFDLYLDNDSADSNMLKNPSFKIELPSNIEKVILGESSIIYSNGLNLQTPYLETNESGKQVIVVNLTGAQTEYTENTIGLITNIKIPATIILNKNIEESAKENINVVYKNQWTLDNSFEIGNKEIEVELQNFQEENEETDNILIYNNAVQPIIATDSDDLKVEIVPTKGKTAIKDNDVVYEGEYIKYNIKVTNNSNNNIDNIKLVANIPDGVTYGELDADYYSFRGKYQYDFYDEVEQKTIDIGSLKVGESTIAYYEVKVDDLDEAEQSKEITTSYDIYVGEEQIQTCEIKNTIQPSDVQVFMGSLIDYAAWEYFANIYSDETKEVTAKIHLPKEFKLEQIEYVNRTLNTYISEDGNSDILDESNRDWTSETVYTNYDFQDDNINTLKIEVSEDNVVTTKLNTNSYYAFRGQMDIDSIEKTNNSSSKDIISYIEIEGDNTIFSNENRFQVAYQNISVTMTSPNEGDSVRYGDEINYDIQIKNNGGFNVTLNEFDRVQVNVLDFLPKQVEPIEVIYDTWELETNESGAVTGLSKKSDVVEDISGICVDEDGNELANVDINLIIPKEENVTLHVKTTAGLVYKETKIENRATITGNEIDSRTTNIVSHTILPDEDENEEPNEPNKPTNPENPNNPDSPDKPDNPNNPEETYSISGIAWCDANEDGSRSSSEKLLGGITVMLVDINNSSEIKNKTQTNSKGEYKFSDINYGKYLVIFQYDTNTFGITEYQKNGISSSINSDAIGKTIKIDNESVEVGLTDTIELNKSVQNIDIGLIENKLCDFKIDKFVSKVTVRTTSGTKVYNYDNEKLAKAEIVGKELNGAIVVVDYKIVVTNVGEAAGSVSKIIDYIPEGWTFTSDLNKNWSKGTNGQIISNSIANKKIQANESVELTLTTTKQMTADTTGTFKNKVELGEVTNKTNTKDSNAENNTSTAEVIISVKTGAIFYTFIIIISLSILCIVAILLYKSGKVDIKKISKMSLLIVFFGMFLFAQSFNDLDVYATDYDDYNQSTEFNWYSLHTFSGGVHGEGGMCGDHSKPACWGTHTYWQCIWKRDVINEKTTKPKMTFKKKQEDDSLVTINDFTDDDGVEWYIFGPFGYTLEAEGTADVTLEVRRYYNKDVLNDKKEKIGEELDEKKVKDENCGLCKKRWKRCGNT